MTTPSLDAYWQPSFETLYQAYYQEMASESLVDRWQRLDIVTSILVAGTASGSTIAGLALWSEPGWKVAWAVVAAVASLVAIAHGAMTVPARVKAQEELRRSFSALRVDLETFRQQLRLGLPLDEARIQYNKLRERYAQSMAQARPDIAYSTGLRHRVQDQVNRTLGVG